MGIRKPDKLILFLLLIVFSYSCSKNNDDVGSNEDNDGNDNDIAWIDEDPSLNQLLFTAVYEEVFGVDPATGVSQKTLTFNSHSWDVASTIEYHDNVIYCVTDNNYMTAYNPFTGVINWTIGLPKPYSSSISKTAPTFYNNTLYVGGLWGILLAVNPVTGEIIWQYSLHDDGSMDDLMGTYGDLALDRDYLVYGTRSTMDDNHLFCINNKTGELIWKKPLKGDGMDGKGVVIENNVVYVPGTEFEARDIQTGEIIWSFPVNDYYGTGKPVIVGNKVIFQGGASEVDAKVYCLDKTNGHVLWTTNAGLGEAARISLKTAGKLVFGVYHRGSGYGGLNGKPIALSVETGDIIWENDDVSVHDSPAYANGRLYYEGLSFDVDNGSGLLCLDAATGEFLWINNEELYQVDITPTIVAENGVFKP